MHSSILRLTRGLAAVCALICLTLGLTTHPAYAQAGYYTYTLNDVDFNYFSSGTASGYFDYDPTTLTVGAFDITTSSGTTLYGPTPGLTYNSDNSSLNPYIYYPSKYIEFESDSSPFFLNLELTQPLTAGITTYNVYTAVEYAPVTNPFGVIVRGGERVATDGTVSVTPEASAVPELSPLATVALLSVLGCGALGLAGVKRRRTSSAAI